jgi:hypothetical protein
MSANLSSWKEPLTPPSPRKRGEGDAARINLASIGVIRTGIELAEIGIYLYNRNMPVNRSTRPAPCYARDIPGAIAVAQLNFDVVDGARSRHRVP